MKILKNKTTAIAISILLILSMTGSIMLTPVVHAWGTLTALPGVAPGTVVPTFLYLVVAPNPIGIGQTVNLDAFFGASIIDSEIPCYSDPQNYNVTVTTPSGTTTTLTLAADKTGGGHVFYVPATVGTYKCQASYGGQAMNVVSGTTSWVGLIQGAAVSAVETFTVQQTPVTQTSYPFTPLPTSWWETPVSAENTQNWYKLMGNDYFKGQYNCTTYGNPYTAPVLSGHIIWTRPWGAGGVVGGDAGGGETNGQYWTIRQYESQFSPIIIDGRMYVQLYPETTSYSYGIYCIDLFSGKDIFFINTTSTLSFGMAPDMSTPNMYGALPYVIWTTGALTPAQTGGHLIVSVGTQYNMFSGFDGQYILSIVNGTSVSNLHTDNMGNMIGYYTNTTIGTMSIWNPPPFNTLLANGTTIPFAPTLQQRVTITANPNAPGGLPYLCEFNFTQALWDSMATSGGIQIGLNTAIDFRLGTIFAAPIPTTLNGGYIYPAMSASYYTGNQVICTSYMYPGVFWQDGWNVLCAMNANNGHVNWIENLTYPTYQSILGWARWSHLLCSDVYVIVGLHNWVMDAFNVETGQHVWTNQMKTNWGDGAPNPLDEVANTLGFNMNINNQCIIATFGGDMWDINITNGNTIWYTNTTNVLGPSGIETPYGVWPLWSAFACELLDSQCAYYCVGHEYNPPLFHGAQIFAINITNGKLVWKELDFPTLSQEEGYGVLLSLNCYDNQIYAFDKGPSSTTVTAPNVGVTTGTPITISGTVMDVSPGTTQEQQKYDFPTGVPCVSDASESAFMEYVYQDQPEPTNVTGVPVTLTETDHNGNTYTIGTTRSNGFGTFAFTWTPPIDGNYTIVATFAGSNSYWGSSADTYVYAGPAAAATSVSTTAPVSGFATTNDLMLGIVAIIVVIIISVAVLAVVLRRRP